MGKFKVGDIIKCVKDYDCRYVNTSLKKAEVLDINFNEMTFKILEHSYETFINTEMICTFENFEEYFELVDDMDSLYPYITQPNFKLTEDLQKEWNEISEKSFKGKPVIALDEVCGKNLFDGAIWKNDFYEKYILGIWEKEEEKEMNKVLNLWFERKQQAIIEKYSKMEQDFINNNYSVVQSYNELIAQFEKDLEDLYKFDKANEQFVLEEISDKNTIKYGIDFDKLSCEFTDLHCKEKQDELKEIAKIREEVEAQLSLSDELKYQQEVLIQYDIIDKKTKKIKV